MVDVVRASIIGTILGNALLVLGISVCVGGFKHGRLNFEVRPASQYASLFALCIGGLVLPTVAQLLAARSHQTLIVERGEQLSDIIAVVLLLGYIASILFSVFHIGDKGDEEEVDPVIGARSEAAISRLLAFRQAIVTSAIVNKSGMLKEIDGTVETIKGADVPKVEDATREKRRGERRLHCGVP